MLDTFIEFIRTLTNPDGLRLLLTSVFGGWQGYALLFAIVFSETGLLAGFFLPGDSLLFTVGVVAGAGGLNVFAIIGVLIAAAIIGDATGYLLGRRAGPAVFNRPDSRLFKQEHLRKTKEFYEKHGGKTIIYARFIPIVRTFAPFIAGVAEMEYGRFARYNVLGGIGWVVLTVTVGYLIGDHEFVRRHFEKVLVGIVLISVSPIVFEYFRSRKKS
jgi:membrane-associated protein